MRKFLANLWADDTGASLVEYSVVVGLVTAATIVLIEWIGVRVYGSWDAIEFSEFAIY